MAFKKSRQLVPLDIPGALLLRDIPIQWLYEGMYPLSNCARRIRIWRRQKEDGWTVKLVQTMQDRLLRKISCRQSGEMVRNQTKVQREESRQARAGRTRSAESFRTTRKTRQNDASEISCLYRTVRINTVFTKRYVPSLLWERNYITSIWCSSFFGDRPRPFMLRWKEELRKMSSRTALPCMQYAFGTGRTSTVSSISNGEKILGILEKGVLW